MRAGPYAFRCVEPSDKDLDSASRLQVFSGEANYQSPPKRVWEQPAEFYCPVIASLVTGGSHLLCAMLERSVRDIGGHIAAMDTDSAMIVSTKDGRLIPCAGGPHKLDNYELGAGNAAIRALSRAEPKFCTPNGSICTSGTIGLLVRRHITAGEFHYVGKEASTRWGSGPDLSMMTEAGALDPLDETFREYERVVDPKYLEEVRAQAKQFSTKLLSRQSAVAECAIRSFKRGSNTIRPRSLRKLIRAIHDLQNRNLGK